MRHLHWPRRTRAATVTALASALLLAACGGGGDKAAPPEATGNPAAPSTATPVPMLPGMDSHAQILAVPAAADTATPLSTGCTAAGSPRRLTRVQLHNVLRDTLGTLTGEPSLTADLQTLLVDVTQFPPDRLVNPDSARHTGFERLDTQLNARQLAAITQLAETLATRATATDARVATLLAGCSGAGCLDAFIRRAGRLFFRMPLLDAEVAIYRSIAGGQANAQGLRRVLASMMASPRTVLVVERGQAVAADSGNCVPLTAHELATRLALHLWDTVPDAPLAAAADDGSLLTPTVLRNQVQRLVADARAEAPLRRFFDQWLRLQELVPMDGKVGNARFDAFAGSFRPGAGTRDAAINEVLDMVSWLAARGGSLQQVLTDRRSFARTPDIAAIYGVPVWDGVSEPPVFADSERVGLLTRIGVVANGASETTLPIQRAIRVLSALTCQPLPPPAMDQSNARADLSGVLTTRQRTERVTQMPGTSCVGCHTSLVNPWGFVFERFDALGRVRSQEAVLDDGGRVAGLRPLETAVVVSLAGMPSRAINTPLEAQQYILESGHFERCFARHYVRYTFGRADRTQDAELIDALRREAAAGTQIRALMASVALRREFTMIAKLP